MTADEYVYVYFAYRTGDKEALLEGHRDAFEASDRFDVSHGFVESPLGSVRTDYNDVPGITNQSWVDYFEHDGRDGELDLLYSPLVLYDFHVDDLGEDGLDREKLDALVEMVRVGYEATEERPLAAYVETPKHLLQQSDAELPPFTAESLLRDEYEYLSWGTVFTPPMVEHYGRERLRSAPAWRVTELDDGAIFVACHDRPLDWDADCRDVAEHLGLPSFEEIA